MRLGQPERDAGFGHADGPDPRSGGSVLQRPAQEAVGGLEGLEGRDFGEALQEGGRVDRVIRGSAHERELTAERGAPVPPPGPARQGGAGERPKTQRNQFGQMVSGAPRAAVGTGRWLVRGGSGEGKSEAPPGADPVGIDEAGARGHGAPQVENSDRRPVGTVAQALVRDAPERLAGLHGVGCPGCGGFGAPRSLRDGKPDADVCARRRRTRTGTRRERERRPDAGERQHADGDTRRDPVQDRPVPARTGVAAPDLRDHGAHQLGAAGGPGHPCRHGQCAERVARKGLPGVPEAARQGIADHGGEHGRDSREGEQCGNHRRGHVQDPAPARRRTRPIHPQGRS